MPFTVSTWLAERNEASWRDVVGFYENVVLDSDWITPLLRVARNLSASEYAKSFRAGTSLITLVISTEWQNGLEDGDAFVAINLQSGGEFQLRYRIAFREETLEEHQCDEADILLHLTCLLERLWKDRPNEHEARKRWAKGGHYTP